MGSFSIWHWMVVLLIVVLIFGTKKLKNLGQDLGGAVKGFKEGMKEGSDAAAANSETASADPKRVSADTIDVEAKEKERT